MPDTITSTRSDLKDALADLTQAKANLTELERGQTSAREKSWDLSSKVEEAQEHLAALKKEEPRRLASAWIASDTVEPSPVPAAEHALAQARQERENIHKIESALAAEIPTAQHRLNDMQRAFCAELAATVTSSQEYESLRQAHTNAWRNLRTIRECLKVAHAAMKGQCPQAYMDAAQRAEPSFRMPGFPVDESAVKQWADALDQLSADADAKLPS